MRRRATRRAAAVGARNTRRTMSEMSDTTTSSYDQRLKSFSSGASLDVAVVVTVVATGAGVATTGAAVAISTKNCSVAHSAQRSRSVLVQHGARAPRSAPPR